MATIEEKRLYIELWEANKKAQDELKWLQENRIKAEIPEYKTIQAEPEKKAPKTPKVPTAQEIYEAMRDGKPLDKYYK